MKSLKYRLMALVGAAALALVGGLAIAQTVSIPSPTSMGVSDRVQVIPNGQPSAQSVYATLTQFRAWLLGGASAHSGTPALTSCGTSPAISGSDSAGTITLGTGTPTGCVATFAQAYTGVPYCVVTSQTAPATTTPAYSVTATAITIAQAANNSTKYDYVCVARAGG